MASEGALPLNFHGELRGHEGSVMSVRFNGERSEGSFVGEGG